MKYLDEFRDSTFVKNLHLKINELDAHPWTIMEICGGQTHTILKYNIEDLLPEKISLIHGPGCPVCVTPLEMIDKAIAIASREDVIFTSFGDMMRVPGSKLDLLSVKAEGGNVKMVYSPLDALKLAERYPDKKIVFFAVGFETTAPANAFSVIEAKRRELKNYSLLCSHVLVPPAVEALLNSKENRIQALLAAGHVCTVMGFDEYIPLSKKYKIPIIVTGFEPVDILQGIYMAVKQLKEGRHKVENSYSRVVTKEGNFLAKKLLNEVFDVTDRKWRGIGLIPKSGFKLKEIFSDYDAEKIFDLEKIVTEESELCIAGKVLQGQKKPFECSAFGSLCTPEHPIGAPMVSTEGACSAYFNYRKSRQM